MDHMDAVRAGRNLVALAHAAAPAPWHVVHADAFAFMSASFISDVASNEFPGANHVIAATYLAPDWATHPLDEENEAFIVAARAAAPAVGELVEALLLERRELRCQLRGLLAVIREGRIESSPQMMAAAQAVLDSAILSDDM